jgi:hypothetical protein
MIKSREEILKEIIKKGKEKPKGWKATYRIDPKFNSLEYCLMNPEVGIYKIKEWQKNPFQVKGVGGMLARKVDEDLLDEEIGDFGIVKYEPRKLVQSMERGIPLKEILKGAFIGQKDKGIDLTLKGEMHRSKKINERFGEKKKEIDEEFEKLLIKERAFEGYA